MKIPALTVWQPWATLIALAGHPDPEIRAQAKHFETRPWGTQYRGIIAIHSAASRPTEFYRVIRTEPFRTFLAKVGYESGQDFPFGQVITICNLVDAIKIDLVGKNFFLEKGRQSSKSRIVPLVSANELAFGNFRPGRFALKLDNIRPMSKPVRAKGNRKLWWWDVPTKLITEVFPGGGCLENA
jgi:hypothetical protein